MNSTKIVVFGASKAGERAYKILNSFDVKVEFYIDNDKNKINTFFCNSTVRSPEFFKYVDKDQYYIVIASMYYSEIAKQLNEYGLEKGKHFDYIDNYIIKCIEEKEELYKNEIKINQDISSNSKKNILITLPNGLILGGVETWCLNISNHLNKKYDNSYLLNLKPYDKSDFNTPEDKIIDIHINEDEYLNSLIKACNNIIRYLPCNIITNGSFEMLQVAYILKKVYFNHIRVISVVHNDNMLIYDQNLVYSNTIDKFLCVSKEIEINLMSKLINRKEDILTRISPIQVSSNNKAYSKTEEPLKIGFAGRLVKEQKRCDYLIELIKSMQEENLNYEIHIAGDGPYYKIIDEFIENKKIKNKVFLYGKIPFYNMNEFWYKLDVYLNLSDYEGTSLSMLEAMGNGLVPVVTNVSGVKAFIENSINGFIVEPGDIQGIKDRLLYVSKNRNILKIYGGLCIDNIKEKCSMEKYLNCIVNL